MTSNKTTSPAPLAVSFSAERLWVGGHTVDLRPKTWSVLCRLLRSPGELVSKDELLDEVWSDAAVTEGTLNKSISELRAALGDTSQNSRCIETVSRRGFRWIGTINLQDTAPAEDAAFAEQPAAALAQFERSSQDTALDTSPLVARDAELAHLQTCLSRARRGQRQIVFLHGEAGSGKTTLVDRFLEAAQRGSDPALVAYGQCLELFGEHEPYRPIFDAIEHLARDQEHREAVAAALRHRAPTWVEHTPSLAAALGPSAESTPRSTGRLLRELTGALRDIASDVPLILVLEDAHWADLATTDTCNALARERDNARILVLVTMRDAEAIVVDHPIAKLKRDLVVARLAEEVALSPFGGPAIAAYLATRCPGLDRIPGLPERLLTQTAGNPLFVRLIVDDWIARGAVVPTIENAWVAVGDPESLHRTVPDTLLMLLEDQLAKLNPQETSLLEAASVHSGEFDASSLASILGQDAESIESICRNISRRRQLLAYCGRTFIATGQMAERYGFLHAAVRRVVASRIPPTRFRRLHQAAAVHLETAYAGRTFAVSPQLGVHYEAAGDIAKAVPYLRDSARLALRRDSPRDAIATLERVLELLDRNPDLPEGKEQRLLAVSQLSHAQQLLNGFTTARVAALWDQTKELAGSQRNTREQAIADAGRAMVCCVTGQYAAAEEILREALPALEHVEDEGGRQSLLFSAASVRYRVGALADSSSLFEAALALKNVSDPVPGADMEAILKSQYAPVLVVQGRVALARQMVAESLERARAHSHYCECASAALAALALALLHDFEGAVPIAARCLEIAEADGYRVWITRPQILLAVAEIRGGAIESGLEKAIAALRDREREGQMVDHSAHLCLIAEALIDAGQDASVLLEEAEAHIARTGERYVESEIFRLRAKALQLEGGSAALAEQQLRQAIELASLRDIHWHELLAARDLGLLLRDDDRADEALPLLRAAYAHIEGGAEEPAMKTVRELLNS